ncbi:MAG: ATP-binding protein, partial [Aquaticitalea sp.]
KENDTIKITIQDDGKGFDISKIDFGNGIENMKKRIEDSNGSFDIRSQPNNGTIVTISVPLKQS